MTMRRLERGTLERRRPGGPWTVRFRVEVTDPETGHTRQRQRREELGWFRTRRAAVKALEEFWAALRATEVQGGQRITLAAYWERYAALHLPLLRPSSRRAYAASIRPALELHGRLQLHQVDAAAVQKVINRLHAGGKARSTIRQAAVRLVGLLGRARREGFAAQTISFKALSMPSESGAHRVPRAVSPEELDRIVAASPIREQAIWLLGAEAGLRAGEIVALSWDSVDTERGVLRVLGSATGGRIHAAKTSKAVRSVPLQPRLQRVLVAFRHASNGQPGQLLFPSLRHPECPVDQDDVRRRVWYPLLDRLGIARVGLHGLRHALAARLAQLGLSEAEAAAWLGHSSIQQTHHYTHLREAQLVESLAAALRRTGEKEQ